MILLNGLLSFQFLSRGEIYLFHSMFRDKYGEESKEFSSWENDEENRILKNEKIPLEIKIPEGLYFHPPSTFDLENKTGSGEIAGIISSSPNDPNLYPLVRIFVIGGYQRIEKEKVKEEYEQILQFESQRGEIDTIEFLTEHTPENKTGWEGIFWSFFDLNRPHYCKTGFYFLNKHNGNYVILDIRENLIQSSFHEESIQLIIDSLK